jgi:hypothetical protein
MSMTSLLSHSIFVNIRSIFNNKKTARFAVTAAIGAFVGSLIGIQVGGDGGLINVAAWDACIGVGIGVAIAWVQNQYMRASSVVNVQLVRTGLRCALGGAAGGAGLILMKAIFGGGAMAHIGAWTVEGLVMGWLLAPVFPNLPKQPAILSGLLAGFMGALIAPFLAPLFGNTVGVALADALKGLFLGAMLTLTEKYQAISNGSLIVHWGPNEQSTILLGEDPIAIGSDRKCQIYLKRENETHPPIVAEIVQTRGKTVLHDKKNNKTTDLPDGTVVNIGTLKIEVRAGIHQSALQKAQKS